MLERICDFLRSTLRLPDSPMVPVATELSLVRQYLEVMKARLEDRLQYEIHCDPHAESVSHAGGKLPETNWIEKVSALSGGQCQDGRWNHCHGQRESGTVG